MRCRNNGIDVSDDIQLEFGIINRIAYTDHNKLQNRSLPDQHPIEAITGLKDRLQGLDDRLAGLEKGNTVEVKTRSELPNRGTSSTVYIVTDENASYRWDEDNSKYFCIGRDYEELEIIICGGNA